MRQIIRRKPSGQVLGVLLCLVGLGILLVVFWKAWPSVSASSNFLSALGSYILTEQISITSFATLKLTYLTIMATIFLVLGIVAIGFSRQIFYLSGESVSLQCPYCKNSWRARRAMAWAECPYCRKFIQPQATKKEI